MQAEDKRKQLFELTSIVLGIRLFNKEIGKGGMDLPNLEDICRAEAADILSNLKQKLVCTQAHSFEITLLEQIILKREENRNSWLVDPRYDCILALLIAIWAMTDRPYSSLGITSNMNLHTHISTFLHKTRAYTP